MDATELKAFVSDMLARLNCDYESMEVSNGPRVIVAITARDPRYLVGPNGEHLQSLNIIMRRMAEKAFGATANDFLIDVNRFHANRLSTLQASAQKIAQRTRLFKHEVEMDPMNSYERLVIHELFAKDPDIETASSGEGKMRHIVLKPRVSAMKE